MKEKWREWLKEIYVLNLASERFFYGKYIPDNKIRAIEIMVGSCEEDDLSCSELEYLGFGVRDHLRNVGEGELKEVS